MNFFSWLCRGALQASALKLLLGESALSGKLVLTLAENQTMVFTWLRAILMVETWKQHLELCSKLIVIGGNTCGCFPFRWATCHPFSVSPSASSRRKPAWTPGVAQAGGFLLLPSRWCCPIPHPGENGCKMPGKCCKARLVRRCLLHQQRLVREKLSATQRGFSVPLPQWPSDGPIKVPALQALLCLPARPAQLQQHYSWEVTAVSLPSALGTAQLRSCSIKMWFLRTQASVYFFCGFKVYQRPWEVNVWGEYSKGLKYVALLIEVPVFAFVNEKGWVSFRNGLTDW